MPSSLPSFNEAAGFTRRKPGGEGAAPLIADARFNEAAGFTRRKRQCTLPQGHSDRHASMRPPDLPGGNRGNVAAGTRAAGASMRPPDLPGGNAWHDGAGDQARSGFNEAAGFTRRKPMAAFTSWSRVTSRLQ